MTEVKLMLGFEFPRVIFRGNDTTLLLLHRSAAL